jgi:cell division septation protein DedD
MDTAMRDLEQLRERGDETTGRKVGLFALAAVLSVSAIFALGLMLRSSGEAEDDANLDPLAQLALTAEARPQAKALLAKPPEVKPESLSFPAALLDREEAMLEATIRAAEEEHAVLSGRAPAEVPDLPRPSLADLPAGSLAIDDSARLARAAKHDPLIAEGIPTQTRGESAPMGHEGAYTLQVVSYDNRAEADQFATALRARGHKAFVTRAEVPDRGQFFRVRVGPFSTRQEAIGYQDAFERDERMHTILVSNNAN